MPIIKNNPWFLTYLSGSLNLYIDHIEDDEYIINNPNKDMMIIDINNT
jgi:hypothetical protein